ncbi:EH signature domain-containing protein [Neptuniibacter marinus]|uniref:EH signature domain-containing protein n=1 Tax=Neptuniibacter marinus TaxID=1806670 RepID=UPI003B5A0487
MDLALRFHEHKSIPDRMIRLARGLEQKEWSPGNSVDAFPPKSVEEVLDLLRSDQAGDIAILDWITLFDAKNTWDSTHSDIQIADTTVLIYKAIQNDQALTHLTLFRALLTIDGSGSLLPKVLLEYLHLLSEHLEGSSLKLLDIALFARAGKFEAIAGIAADLDLTVDRFYASYHLPKCTNLKRKTVEALSPLVKSIDISRYDTWLVKVFSELQRADAVGLLNALLETDEKHLKSSTELISWFEKHCHPRIENSFWFELKNNARAVLRKLIRVSEFYLFKQLVRLLRDDDLAEEIGLDDKDKNQIRKRAIFWEHYDSRMLSLRVLVSGATKVKLPQFMANSSWLESLEDEVGSEIVIMEFDQHIIVEFLRGGTSEVRLFNKSTRNANLLLMTKNLSIKSIRQAFHDDVHDHVFMWQWSCEAWLRKCFRILPNDEVVRFRGLPPNANDYSPKHGLPKPDGDLIARRAEELEPWFTSFFEREKSLGKLGKSLHDANAQKYLLKGKRYDDLGYLSKMAESFEISAKLGNSEAMYLLAAYLLSCKPLSMEKRVKGEFWLEKAAKAGHPKAVKLLPNSK